MEIVTVSLPDTPAVDEELLLLDAIPPVIHSKLTSSFSLSSSRQKDPFPLHKDLLPE